MSEKCECCNGRGRTTCPECDGNGYILVEVDDGYKERECNTCYGEQKIDCDECDGKGYTE